MTSLNTIITPVDIKTRKELDFRSGDTIRVWQKVKEKSKDGEKTRLQAFEGIVLARKHGGEAGATFIVRKVSSGVGVERIFPLFSPEIDRVEIVARASKRRRSKLYYIRDIAAREVRRKMKHVRQEAARKPVEVVEPKIEAEQQPAEKVVTEKEAEITPA